MDDEKYIGKFMQLQNRINSIRTEISIKTLQTDLDLIGYLDLIAKRPLEIDAKKFLAEGKNAVEENTKKCVSEVKDQIEFFNRVHSSIWGYGQKKTQFRELIDKLLKKQRDINGFEGIIEDWKSIRRLINDINLCSPDFMGSYVLIESIFRILKYFHESRDTGSFQKTTELVKTLISKYKIKDIARRDDLLYRCLDFFLGLSDEDAMEIMIGRRSTPISISYLYLQLENNDPLDSNHSKKLKTPIKKEDPEVKLDPKTEELHDSDTSRQNTESEKKAEHPIAKHLSKVLNPSGEKIKVSALSLEDYKQDLIFSKLIGAPVKSKSRETEVKKLNDLDQVSDSRRTSSIYFIFDSLSFCYEKQEALRLARTLESQVFASNSDNSVSYDNEIRKAGNTIDLLSKNKSVLDRLQERFISFELLKNASSAPINDIELGSKDQAVQVKLDTQTPEISPDFDEEVSLDKMTEAEIKCLRQLVSELQSDNKSLKRTLADIRVNLVELSSPAKTVN